MDPVALAEAPPTHVKMGVTPLSITTRLRVVDAHTGFEIAKVTEADSVAGTVTRFAQDESGNLVRKDDAFKVVAEERAIRIEWIEQPVEVGA